MRQVLFFIFILSHITSWQSHANETAEKNSKPIELTPLIGYRFGGDFDATEQRSELSLEDDTSLGLLVAWPFDNKRQGELLVSHYDSTFDDNNILSNQSNDLSVSYLHIGGNVPLSNGIVPIWISGGMGITHLSPDAKSLDDETKFSGNLGIQTKVKFSEKIALHFGARVYATFFDSDSEIFCDNAECQIFISSDVWIQSEIQAGITVAF